MTQPVRILTWNLERVPRARRRALEQVLLGHDYDVAILTETRTGFVHDRDVLVPEGPPAGRFAADERKVAIWSRWGWSSTESTPAGVPAERWVAGTTDTPAGALRVIGLCVPYRFQWVRGAAPGGQRRRVWEEHLGFLDAIADACRPDGLPQVIAGDFNQRVPPVGRLDPDNAVYAREAAMAGHAVLTEDLTGADHQLLLCHVASTVPVAGPVTVVDRHDGAGHALSDHHGAVVAVDLGGPETG